MSNEDWMAIISGCMKIMGDPDETPRRRRLAFNTYFDLTRASVGVTSMRQTRGKQRNTRSAEVITEAEYSGWMSNRD